MTKNHILIRLSESKQAKFGNEEFCPSIPAAKGILCNLGSRIRSQ
jgi:hypothetical protein